MLPRISDHACYVEVFAGGLAVLLAKLRSRIESSHIVVTKSRASCVDKKQFGGFNLRVRVIQV